MKKSTFSLLVAIAASIIFSQDTRAQVALRGTSTNTGTSTSISVNKPAGVVQNDVMIAVIAKEGNTANATAPAGWTLIAGTNLGGGTNRNGTVFYKVAGAAEGASYSFTLGSGTNHVAATIVAYSGVDVSGPTPFDVAPASSLNLGGSGATTATALSLTTVTNSAGIVMCTMAAGSNPSWSAWTTTSPGALTEVADIAEGNGSDGASAGVAWAIKSSAGATGNGTATLSPGERNGAILIALKSTAAFTVNAGADQLVSGTSVSLSGSTTAGSPTYLWTKSSGPAGGSITAPANSSTTVTGLSAGTYVFRLTVNGSVFDEVTVVVITGTNLWATSTDGTQISSFSVSLGTVNSGPTNMFAPSFTGSTNTYTRTAALGRNNIPSGTAGYFYYLGSSTGGQTNDGIVEVWGASAAGAIAKIGQLDLNGAGNGAELGFVRLGMGPDGTGWILAGDGTTLYLAKFASNGLNPVTPVIESSNVTLVGGTAATFVNGDLCLDGNGKLVVLANNGSGTTQIYTGSPAGAGTTLTKKWDVFDGSGNAFSNTVNGVAFDVVGGLYVSTSDGLYYINQATANSNTNTVNCVLALAVTGLQDLASNVFPNTIITPVKMGSFDVTKQGSNAVLNWTTVSEINSDHFEIERSTDGINFVKVGTKQAAGNSSSVRSYQFIDPIAANTDILYYRIKTVDIDAKAALSKIVTLRINSSIVKSMTVYPNPFSSNLKIELNTDKDAAITLRIRNAAGQAIVDRSMLVQKGNNVIVLSSELASANAGMYLVEVITEEGKQVQKIIKR